jgi:hypothetical protein
MHLEMWRRSQVHQLSVALVVMEEMAEQPVVEVLVQMVTEQTVALVELARMLSWEDCLVVTRHHLLPTHMLQVYPQRQRHLVLLVELVE